MPHNIHVHCVAHYFNQSMWLMQNNLRVLIAVLLIWFLRSWTISLWLFFIASSIAVWPYYNEKQIIMTLKYPTNCMYKTSCWTIVRGNKFMCKHFCNNTHHHLCLLVLYSALIWWFYFGNWQFEIKIVIIKTTNHYCA